MMSSDPKPIEPNAIQSYVWPPKPAIPSFDKQAVIMAYFGGEASRKPRVIGYTNLPEDTELMVDLSRKDIEYVAQSKTVVKVGRFETEPFTSNGGPLPSGKYTVQISTPAARFQPESVKSKLGEKGENLKGSLIKNGFLSKTVEFKEKLQLGEGISQSENADYAKLRVSQQQQTESLQQSIIPAAL